MTSQKYWKSILIIAMLSFAAIAIWLYEIVEIKSWHSMRWLHEPLFSPLWVALMVATAYLTPFMFYKTLSIQIKFASLSTFTIINIIGFYVGQELCYLSYASLFALQQIDVVFMLIIVLGLYILTGIMYWLITHSLIKKNRKKNIGIIATLLIAAVPLSLLTIELFPGFGWATGWIDAVKMGYPIFWTTVLSGAAGLIIVSQR